jgi:serine palmitoyltransferase
MERISEDYNWTFKHTGKSYQVLNLGSYNYLGFAENNGKCAVESIEAVKQYGVANCSPRQELGRFFFLFLLLTKKQVSVNTNYRKY